MNDHYPFELIPLPYAYNALEPYIDEKTMHLHHDKHLQTYVEKLNNVLKDYPEFHMWSLELLLANPGSLPETVRTAVLNNGGGVYNHNFYFANLKNPAAPTLASNTATRDLMDAIAAKYGNFDAFKTEFKSQALAVFGSGYTALIRNKFGDLQIVNLKNQDTVLPLNACLIMLLDVWEHAYYLKHYNVRADYIDAWFHVLDLEKAEANYKYCRQKDQRSI